MPIQILGKVDTSACFPPLTNNYLLIQIQMNLKNTNTNTMNTQNINTKLR